MIPLSVPPKYGVLAARSVISRTLDDFAKQVGMLGRRPFYVVPTVNTLTVIEVEKSPRLIL